MIFQIALTSTSTVSGTRATTEEWCALTRKPVFVGMVWNAYRKCRLLLLNFICNCTDRLGDDPDLPQVPNTYLRSSIIKEARDLSHAIVASIPFLLYRNPAALLSQVGVDDDPSLEKEILLPNSAYSGLLLMHVLQVASHLPIVPESCTTRFNGALSWIGQVMGIGQAGLLANVSFPNSISLSSFMCIQGLTSTDFLDLPSSIY